MTPPVRPGQIWQDNDKRSYGRQVRVTAVDATHALVELHIPRGAGHLHARPGRRTRIRLDRFQPTSSGYRLVQDPAEPAAEPAHSTTLGQPLTDRELQAITMAAHGLSNGEIGRKLFLRVNTVKTHLSRAFSKLGARDRAHAVFLAHDLITAQEQHR